MNIEHVIWLAQQTQLTKTTKTGRLCTKAPETNVAMSVLSLSDAHTRTDTHKHTQTHVIVPKTN